MQDQEVPFAALNIYEMYVARERLSDLWVRRTTWSGMCARITSVAAFNGPPPYYGNPEVRADIYTLDGALKERNAIIPAAGTYKTWRQISQPAWWKKE